MRLDLLRRRVVSAALFGLQCTQQEEVRHAPALLKRIARSTSSAGTHGSHSASMCSPDSSNARP
jgi:hypothetical protein